MLTPSRHEMDNDEKHSGPTKESDLFSMIGCIFLWM